jgi:LmbE family N-acetylglucosaminyl deacetylase
MQTLSMQDSPFSSILLSPHNDDETLFAAYTILREKPLVIICTDSHRQAHLGVTADQRILETVRAMTVLRAPVAFLSIPDVGLTREILDERLSLLLPCEPLRVYAPALDGGNADHDLVGSYAVATFHNVVLYRTYAKDRLYLPEGGAVVPTEDEMRLKERAIDCYRSQLSINRPHFDAIRGKPEYVVL